MKLKFERYQTEAFYRKLLLLDRLNKQINLLEKYHIFNQGYCWDILFKDKDASKLCFLYAKIRLRKPFPEGEPLIALNAHYSYEYATKILKDRFPMGEKIIKNSDFEREYKKFVEKIGKLDEYRI